MLTRRAVLAAPLLILPLPVLAAPADFVVTEHGLLIAATTVWGEARGESARARLAVAYVIRNRVVEAVRYTKAKRTNHPIFGPGTLEGVCQAPWQFSVWNRKDKNYPKLPSAPKHPLYPACMKAVLAALNGTEPSPVGLSNHYHDHGHPRWARGRKPIAVIDGHTFYRL